jgi:hypothetical protein
MKRKFKEGDLIKRTKGKITYSFVCYGNYGMYGDMRIKHPTTKKIHTIFESYSTWIVISNTQSDLFPIF